MALFELVEVDVVKTPLKSKKKNDVIKELVKILKDSGKIKDSKKAIKAVLEREELSSTGLGEGIAIPHAKSDIVKELTIAIGLAPKGIDFDSLDDMPSTIFFLILAAPDQTGPHLQALTEIANITKNKKFCNAILNASNSKEVVELFSKESF